LALRTIARGIEMDMRLEEVKNAISDLRVDDISKFIQECVIGGIKPNRIIESISSGMNLVGKKFERGEYFLPELITAGEMMKEGLKILEPLLKTDEKKESLGKVILATVEDDIHDIGKNIVNTMLSAAGFSVIDLGVNVPSETIVQRAREEKANIIALSALLTMTVDHVGEVVKLLKEKGIRQDFKVIAGGACVTDEIAKKLGCDAFGRDAIVAVDVCKKLLS
jgi:corrinoid protein of di/trimethylamine methyltransferase